MDPHLQRLYYLQAMGIEVWEQRVTAASAPPAAAISIENLQSSGFASVVEEPPRAIEGSSLISTLDWESLIDQVLHCTRCSLHKNRTQAVFGVGNRQAKFMVVGEAPGAEEDRLGEPFVGRAGKLLNEMLWAIGFKREEVYIANVLKCRPPNNRDPLPDEVNACEPNLQRQIDLTAPKVILAVGRIAAHNLLKRTTNINGLRGQVLAYRNIPLIITYHPAYLLRSPLEKRKAWDDLKFAFRIYKEHS